MSLKLVKTIQHFEIANIAGTNRELEVQAQALTLKMSTSLSKLRDGMMPV